MTRTVARRHNGGHMARRGKVPESTKKPIGRSGSSGAASSGKGGIAPKLPASSSAQRDVSPPPPPIKRTKDAPAPGELGRRR
jgi:hypothetical protein